MIALAYLQGVLAREAVNTGLNSPALYSMTLLMPALRSWANGYLVDVTPSGSFAKGTANASGTDIDLFISLSNGTPNTLAEIYNTLFAAMDKAGLSPTRQNVSINVKVNGLDVDLVPAKRHDGFSEDHSLYRSKAATWTKTNVTTHINTVRAARRQAESRLLKIWRHQKRLEFPSFYLELTVIDALRPAAGDLPENIVRALTYLRDDFEGSRVVDPANTANIISDDLTGAEKTAIARAADAALKGTWEGFVR